MTNRRLSMKRKRRPKNRPLVLNNSSNSRTSHQRVKSNPIKKEDEAILMTGGNLSLKWMNLIFQMTSMFKWTMIKKMKMTILTKLSSKSNNKSKAMKNKRLITRFNQSMKVKKVMSILTMKKLMKMTSRCMNNS